MPVFDEALKLKIARYAIEELRGLGRPVADDRADEGALYAAECVALMKEDARTPDPETHAHTAATKAVRSYVKAALQGKDPESDEFYLRALRLWRKRARSVDLAADLAPVTTPTRLRIYADEDEEAE